MYLKDEEIRSDVRKRTPGAEEELDAIKDFGLFAKEDLEKSIRDDVEQLKQTKVLGGMEIRGFWMDTESGIVTEVDA